MSVQYKDSKELTKKRCLSGVDLYLKAAFTTELENMYTRKEKYTNEEKIVVKYLKKRIKQFEQIGA